MTIFMIMISYILGIIWGLYIKNIVLLFILIITIILTKKIRKLNKYIKLLIPNKKLILILITFIISFTNILILENSFKTKYKNISEEIKVEGVVISNRKEKEYKDIYTIKVKTINENNKYNGTRLQLSIKKGKDKLEYGDKITFTGKYEEAQTQRNYGGFNYKEYLKTKKIYGLIETNKIEKIEKAKYNKLLILINKLSTKIVENSNKILEKEEAGVLTGILIGKKENVSDEVQESFKNSNLSHMLAVSGAHVTYVILGITFILKKSKTNKKISKIVTIFLLILFIFLTGGTSSVTRACIMAIYIILASLIYKKPHILAEISISVLIILTINPYKILDIGMQLSYGGTLGIIFLSKTLTQKIKLPKLKSKILNKLIIAIKEMMIVSISANLIIFPIIAFHYNTISLTFFISNILACPLLGSIIILGFITIFISFISVQISKIPVIILSIFIKLLMLIANFSQSLPLSKIYVKTPSMFTIMIYYIILTTSIYLIKNRKKTQRCNNIEKTNITKVNTVVTSFVKIPEMNDTTASFNLTRKQRRFETILLSKLKNRNTQKKLISIILVIILISQIIKILPSNLKIYFIDVGQGDSTLIITPSHKTMLIDGGGSESTSSYDVGKNTLLPYLLDRGIKKLDYIFISHFDSDHVRTVY